MRCPYCSYSESKVIDSRPAEEGTTIRRRRECLSCGYRFTSYERIDEKPFMVVKRDGRRQPFDREKLEKGIIRALEKRPVSTGMIEQLCNDIEDMAVKQGKESREISTEALGELVLEKLYDIDKVSYIRFASVYREFKDVNTFMNELKKMLDN